MINFFIIVIAGLIVDNAIEVGYQPLNKEINKPVVTENKKIIKKDYNNKITIKNDSPIYKDLFNVLNGHIIRKDKDDIETIYYVNLNKVTEKLLKKYNFGNYEME